MDIFSATNEQVVQTSQSTVDTSANNNRKPVENIAPSTKTQDDQMSQNDKKKQLSDTVDSLNEQMESLDTNVKFGFNDKIDTMYVSVIEKSSGKVIRKIPTDEAMELSEKMKEVVGMIFDKKG